MAEVLTESFCHLSKEQWQAGEIQLLKEYIQKEQDIQQCQADSPRPVTGHSISESA